MAVASTGLKWSMSRKTRLPIRKPDISIFRYTSRLGRRSLAEAFGGGGKADTTALWKPL